MTGKKCDKTAEMLRTKALNFFKKGQIHECLMQLNKSLCHASSPSKLAEIYVYRANVYFELKFYDKCLNNLSLARKYKSVSIKEDLKDLEEKCLEILDSQVEVDDPWTFFKLSYNSHPKVPYVIDCLEVRRNERFGRHVITTRNLAAGEIIAIEKPFFKFLKTDPEDLEYPETNIFNYCVTCLSDNFLDLIPCPSCTTTMFCNEKCYEQCMRSFHQYECNMNELLEETGNFRMALRSFFVSLSICDGSIEKLKQFMRISDLKNPTILDYDLNAVEDDKIDESYLKSMIALANNTSISKIKDFTQIFNSNSHLKEIWSQHRDFINEYICRMHQVEILNFHGIKGRSLKKSDSYRRCVGDGSYAFCSLLNHSCCPNVMRIVVDNRMVVIVERPIKANEQIFDCYIGDSYYFKGKHFRQEELDDYNFICECAACINQYPDIMSGLLNIKDMDVLKSVQREYNKLQDPRNHLSVSEAKRLSKLYSDMLNNAYVEQNYPTREVVLLQLCIIKCFLTAAKSTILIP